MKHSVWIFSVLLASVFLLGYWMPDLSRESSPGTVLASPSHQEPLTPADRKAMEAVALDFSNHYYTYTYENYLEESLNLLPLLTENFQQPYQTLVESGLIAAKAVQAKSTVTSTQILSVEKKASDQGFAYLHFKAKVSNNGKETLTRYSVTLDLKKEADQWRINGILSEDPVEFIDLKNLF